MATKPGKLIVIVGQTASGKSDIALELARRFNGELICADARTVYRHLEIGTAKPSADDRRTIKHHLLDIVNPDERFTAAEFKQLAVETIEDIIDRDKLPIMVGGTGLYIDSVLYDFSFSKKGTAAGRDPQNPRHAAAGAGTSKPLRPNTLIIGMDIDKQVLDERIAWRIHRMFDQGLQKEIDGLLESYSWEDPGMNAIGYKEWREFFDKPGISLAEVATKILKNTRAYAKRQKTWFKRNKSIQWLKSPLEAVALTTTFLNKD